MFHDTIMDRREVDRCGESGVLALKCACLACGYSMLGSMLGIVGGSRVGSDRGF